MTSIFEQDPEQCFLCGRRNATDTHHIFPGRNRQKSDEHGLAVRLCRACHQQVHEDPALMLKLQAYCQEHAMLCYDWSMGKWLAEFGKNYLEKQDEQNYISKDCG